MTEQPKDGGPAFPFAATDPSNEAMQAQGMSLRDWFAGQALITLGECNPNLPDDPADIRRWPDPQIMAVRRAKWAYLQADAMLAARGAK